MKRIVTCFWLVLCAVFLSVYGLGGMSRQKKEPMIHVSPPSHDLGIFVLGEKKDRTARFDISNRGTAPLRILGVNRSCGCAHVEVGKFELLPNEQTELVARVEHGDDLNSLSAAIELLTNDSARPVVRITLSWNIVPPIICDPPVLELVATDRNRVVGVVETYRPKEVDLVYSDIEEIACWPPVVEARLDFVGGDQGAPILRHGVSDEVVALGRLSVYLPVSLSAVSGTCTLKFVSKRGHTLPPVNIAWKKVESVTANPKSIYFGVVAAGKRKEVTVILEANDGRPLSIMAVATSVPWIEIERITERDAAVQKLLVSMSVPDNIRGAVRETVNVRVTGVEDEVVIPVLAWSRRENQSEQDAGVDAD